MPGIINSKMINMRVNAFLSVTDWKQQNGWRWVALIPFAIFMAMHSPGLKNGATTMITIDGHVTRGAPFAGEVLPNTKVYFFYPEDAIPFDSAVTNSNGYYTRTFDFVKVPVLDEDFLKGLKVFGNPFVDEATIGVGVPEDDNYLLRVFDVSGRIILSQEVNLSEGNNVVTLSGLGDPGVKVVSFSNGKEVYTEKIVQSYSNSFSPGAEVVSSGFDSGSLKNTEFIADSLLIRYVPEAGAYLNFASLDRIVEAVTSTQDAELTQLPYNFSTTLKPFLETGEPVTNVSPGFFVNVDFGEGDEQYFVDDGEISIEKALYPHADYLGTLWISNDTSSYVVDGVSNGVLNWTLIRRPHQKTNRPNVAQNESSNHMAYVAYETEVPQDSLDQQVLYLYTIRKKAETQIGVYESMNSSFSRGLVESSGNIKSSMSIDLAPFGVADSLDVVRFGFNYDTDIPNTPEQQQRINNLVQLALETRYLQNGDTLLPPHRVYTIMSYSDPRWQELIARNYENLFRVAYYNGSPENTRIWSSTYTYNGELRLQKTFAKVNVNNNNAQIFAENFSAVTGMEEGAGQNLSIYIWNTTFGAPSAYAHSISAVPALLNLGTGQNVGEAVGFPLSRE